MTEGASVPEMVIFWGAATAGVAISMVATKLASTLYMKCNPYSFLKIEVHTVAYFDRRITSGAEEFEIPINILMGVL